MRRLLLLCCLAMSLLAFGCHHSGGYYGDDYYDGSYPHRGYHRPPPPPRDYHRPPPPPRGPKPGYGGPP
ncbi:MAG: hypothetical protein IIZ02_01610, partial [Desulfovibrio sp.]|nr:hypothetical protein [Desulfovibrio sp.]